MHAVEKKIFPKMPARNPYTADDFGNIKLLPKIKFRSFNDLGLNGHKSANCSITPLTALDPKPWLTPGVVQGDACQSRL